MAGSMSLNSIATPHQETLLETLRKKLQEDTSLRGYEIEKIDEPTMLRFLRGMSFDVNRAYDNLSFSLKWRKDFQGIGVDNIKEESVLNEEQKELGFIYKRDKCGRPVLYTRAGKYNRNDRDLEEIWRFGVLLFETAIKSVLPPEEKICVVVDETGFGMHGLDVDVLKLGGPILDRCYPERIANILFINAPTIFSTAWNVISPFIAEHTRTKVRFLTDTKQLFEFINEEDIPVEFGGKDPFIYDCFQHGIVGVPVGEPTAKPTINKIQAVEQPAVTVPSGGTYEHPFEIRLEGDKKLVLYWDFKTDSKDIAFSVLFRDKNGNDSIVVPSRRYESHINRVKNMVTVDRSGTWVLQWDNTYSRWTSKTMSFSAFTSDSL